MRLRMEHAMQTDTIRHRSNGTIDINGFGSATRAVRPLIRSIATIANYALLLPRNPLPPGASSLFVSANVPLLSTKPKT